MVAKDVDTHARAYGEEWRGDLEAQREATLGLLDEGRVFVTYKVALLVEDGIVEVEAAVGLHVQRCAYGEVAVEVVERVVLQTIQEERAVDNHEAIVVEKSIGAPATIDKYVVAKVSLKLLICVLLRRFYILSGAYMLVVGVEVACDAQAHTKEVGAAIRKRGVAIREVGEVGREAHLPLGREVPTYGECHVDHNIPLRVHCLVGCPMPREAEVPLIAECHALPVCNMRSLQYIERYRLSCDVGVEEGIGGEADALICRRKAFSYLAVVIVGEGVAQMQRGGAVYWVVATESVVRHYVICWTHLHREAMRYRVTPYGVGGLGATNPCKCEYQDAY